MKASKYIIFAFCIFTFSFLLGCARTVTLPVIYGKQMTVEVTLAGTVETDANRYFLVLASDPSFRIPLPPPNIISESPEFLEPGMTPLLGSIEAYYTNFYSTWAGYIVADTGVYFSVKGPFALNQTATREFLSNLSPGTNKLTFTFSLDRIFGTTVPETIYFDFVSVPWPDGAQKIPADHLESTNAYISKLSGSTLTVNDDEYDVLDPALNILKCVVTIQ